MNINRQLMVLLSSFFIYSILFVIPAYSYEVDEGWAANIGNNLANGQLLYGDISAPYGPTVFYIYALIISIFGKQFFVFRIVGLIIIIFQ